MTERSLVETKRAYRNNRRFARLKAQNSRLCSLPEERRRNSWEVVIKWVAISGKLEIKKDADYDWCNINCLEISVNGIEFNRFYGINIYFHDFIGYKIF